MIQALSQKAGAFSWLNNTVMFIFDNHDVAQVLASLEEELAKSLNEIRHARQDLEQAHRRCMFAIAGIHNLKTRLGDIDGKEINTIRK